MILLMIKLIEMNEKKLFLAPGNSLADFISLLMVSDLPVNCQECLTKLLHAHHLSVIIHIY